jgi:hypothetical protein
VRRSRIGRDIVTPRGKIVIEEIEDTEALDDPREQRRAKPDQAQSRRLT